MITITGHIFTDVFPINGTAFGRNFFFFFFAGNEKNMGYLLIPKSQKFWEKF